MSGPAANLPSGARSVMASRVEPWDGLDYFPTPPWATRALLSHVLSAENHTAASVWEPACGAGHMAEVLADHFGRVHASDVHDYGRGYPVGSFVGEGPDVAQCPFRPDWIITNPPFNLAKEFALRALNEAQRGVALLVRTTWLEGTKRYLELFEPMRPSVVAMFSERVPMVKGRWDPDASTATAYAWVVWNRRHVGDTRLMWIPPGQRKRLEWHDDRRRFADLANLSLKPDPEDVT